MNLLGIAAVAERLDPASAVKSVDVSGLYVTPGLVDMHEHVYAGTGERNSYAGDNAVYPDGFSFRNGVTTVADAGGAGWRNFEDFKNRVIDRSKTRVLAFLNIVGSGMRGAAFESNLEDIQAAPTAEMALKYKGLIVGIKLAHYAGKYGGDVTQFEARVNSENESFEHYDELIEWKAYQAACDDLVERIEELKHGRFQVA